MLHNYDLELLDAIPSSTQPPQNNNGPCWPVYDVDFYWMDGPNSGQFSHGQLGGADDNSADRFQLVLNNVGNCQRPYNMGNQGYNNNNNGYFGGDVYDFRRVCTQRLQGGCPVDLRGKWEGFSSPNGQGVNRVALTMGDGGATSVIFGDSTYVGVATCVGNSIDFYLTQRLAGYIVRAVFALNYSSEVGLKLVLNSPGSCQRPTNISAGDGGAQTTDDSTAWALGRVACSPNPCLNGGTCASVGGVPTCTCPFGFIGDACQVSVSYCRLPNLASRCPDDWRAKRFLGWYINPNDLTSVPNGGAWGAIVTTDWFPIRLQFGDFTVNGSLGGSLSMGQGQPQMQFAARCDLSQAAAGIVSIDFEFTNVFVPPTVLGVRSLPLARATWADARRVSNPEGRRYEYLLATQPSDPMSYGADCFRPTLNGDATAVVPANLSTSALFMEEWCVTSNLTTLCPSALTGLFSGSSSASGFFTMDIQGSRFSFSSGNRFLSGQLLCQHNDSSRLNAIDLVLQNDGSVVRGLMSMAVPNRPGVVHIVLSDILLRACGRPAASAINLNGPDLSQNVSEVLEMNAGQFQGSCSNGVRDGQEEQVDCGGPMCKPCSLWRSVFGDGFQRNGQSGPLFQNDNRWHGSGSPYLNNNQLSLQGPCALYYNTPLVSPSGAAVEIGFTALSAREMRAGVMMYNAPRVEFSDITHVPNSTDLYDVWILSCVPTADGTGCFPSVQNPRRLVNMSNLTMVLNFSQGGSFGLRGSAYTGPNDRYVIVELYSQNQYLSANFSTGAAIAPIAAGGFYGTNISVTMFQFMVLDSGDCPVLPDSCSKFMSIFNFSDTTLSGEQRQMWNVNQPVGNNTGARIRFFPLGANPTAADPLALSGTVMANGFPLYDTNFTATCYRELGAALSMDLNFGQQRVHRLRFVNIATTTFGVSNAMALINPGTTCLRPVLAPPQSGDSCGSASPYGTLVFALQGSCKIPVLAGDCPANWTGTWSGLTSDGGLFRMVISGNNFTFSRADKNKTDQGSFRCDTAKGLLDIVSPDGSGVQRGVYTNANGRIKIGFANEKTCNRATSAAGWGALASANRGSTAELTRGDTWLGNCNDRVQNNGETGVDCGGTCAPCLDSTPVLTANFSNPISNATFWQNFPGMSGSWHSMQGQACATTGAPIIWQGALPNDPSVLAATMDADVTATDPRYFEFYFIATDFDVTTAALDPNTPPDVLLAGISARNDQFQLCNGQRCLDVQPRIGKPDERYGDCTTGAAPEGALGNEMMIGASTFHVRARFELRSAITLEVSQNGTLLSRQTRNDARFFYKFGWFGGGGGGDNQPGNGSTCVRNLVIRTERIPSSALPCDANPCAPNANCSNVPGGGFLCTCSAGYFGTTCSVAPCQAGQAPTKSRVDSPAPDICGPCPVGTFSKDGLSCRPCNVGTYSNTLGTSQCADCAAGSFASALGSVSCAQCPPGTVTSADLLVKSQCIKCPLGTFAASAGAATCDSCVAGSSTTALGSTMCTACSAGRFSTAGGSCQRCGQGTFAATDNSSSCSLCPAGTFGSGFVSCNPCPPGAISFAGQSACAACPANSYQSGASLCASCPENYQSPAGSIDASACAPIRLVASGLGAVSFSGVTASSFTATVAFPTNNGSLRVDRFVLQVTPLPSGAPFFIPKDTASDANPNVFVVLNLAPRTNYSVSYFVVNQMGSSAVSAAVVVSTAREGPSIVAYIASDPTNSDTVWGQGDQVLIVFNQATNQPSVALTANILALFAFNPSIGSSLSGTWVNASAVRITIGAGVFSGVSPAIGAATVTVLPAGGLQNQAGDSAASASVSPPLRGNWGLLLSVLATQALGQATQGDVVPGTLLGMTIGAFDGSAVLSISVVSPTPDAGTGLSASGGTVAAQVNATGTLTDLVLFLSGVTYRAGPSFAGTAVIRFRLAVGGGVDEKLGGCTFARVNARPTLTAPTTVTVNVGEFSTVVGWTVADSDAVGANDRIRAIASLSGGVLRLNVAVANATFVPAQGTSSAVVEVRGPIAAVNQAIAGLQMNVALESYRYATLLLMVNDLANGGDPALSAVSQPIGVTASCAAAAPPTVLSAQLQGDLVTIAVKLSASVAAGTVASCSDLFDIGTVALLGLGPACVLDGASLSVRLGAGALISPLSAAPGNTLMFVAGAMRRCSAASGSAAQNATVTFPSSDTRQAPVAVISQAPARIGANCGGQMLVIRAQLVSGYGGWGRDTTWQWTLPDGLANYGIVTTQDSLAVDSSYLQPATTYTFTAVAENFIGDTSNTVSATVVTDSSPVPTAECAGSCAIPARSNQAVLLRASVKASPCAGTASNRLTFAWSISPPVAGFNASLVTTPVLWLRSFLLAPNTVYTASLAVSMASNAALTSTTAFTITVAASQVVAVVDTPNIYQGAASPIALGGSQSIEVDTQSRAGLSYAWTCATPDGSTCTDLTSGLPLAVPSTADVLLAVGTLDVGSYVFTLTVTKGQATATATVTVTLVLEAPPRVFISQPPAVVAASDRVVLRCTCDRIANFTWTIRSVTSLTFDSHSPILILNPAYAKGFWAPGDRVDGECSAAATGAPAGRSSFAFTVHSNPAGGSLSASPAVVATLIGEVTLVTQGWASFESATIIAYQFWYLAPSGDRVPVGSKQTSGTLLASSLPSYSAGNSTLTMGVTVFDSLGGVASATINVTVTPVAQLVDTSALSTLLTQKISSAADSGSTDAGLAAASAVLSMVDTVAGNRSQLRADLVDTFRSLAANAAASQPVELLKGLQQATATAADVSPATVASQVGILNTVLTNRQADLPKDEMYSLINSLLQNIINGLAALAHSSNAPSARHGSLQLQAVDSSVNTTVQLYGVVRDSISTVSSSLLTVPGDQYSFTQSGLSTVVVRVTATSNSTVSVSDNSTASSVQISAAALASIASTADVSLILAATNSFAGQRPTDTTSRSLSPAVTLYLDDTSNSSAPTAAAFASGTVQLTIPASCTVTGSQSCRLRCYRWDAGSFSWRNDSVTTAAIADQTTSATNVSVVCSLAVAGTYAVFDASTTEPPPPTPPSSGGSSVNTGAIAGGVIAGVLILALVVYLTRRNSARVTDESSATEPPVVEMNNMPMESHHGAEPVYSA